MTAMKVNPLKVVPRALFALVILLLPFGPVGVDAKVFPNVDYADWNNDANQDRIDDRLMALAAAPQPDPVDGIVLFNRCLTDYDTDFVESYATVEYVGQYVQGIWVGDVLPGTLIDLLGTPHGDSTIFRVELAETGSFSLDISCRAVKARQSANYSPNTAWDQGYTGNNIVIAILDSGVDDLVHNALAGKYVGGYDAEADLPVNPVDALGHGTHVAGIALGVDPNGTYLGVARDARLADVKVGTAAPSSVAHARAVDWCIANRNSLPIHVLNMSYGLGGSCNGKCADCMCVDAAVDKGLVVCIASGNSYGAGYMPSPAAADRSIAVGAVDDHDTVLRTNDTHAAFSNSGPRVTDNDDDTIDEEKPDVVAPGVDIWAPWLGTINQYTEKSGTSMASPHVAGVAAILLSAKPTMTPDDVKATLRSTSRDQAQNVNPAWTANWGKGEVDAHQATWSAVAADLRIESWVRDIYTPTNPRKTGVTTNLNARVRNDGPNAANGVEVLFFTNRNNVGYGGWTQIGQTTVNVANGGMTVATVSWTPLEGHQCIRARAVYSGDNDLSNNQGQDNFDPRPSRFFIEAGTPFDGPQAFRLEIESYELEPGWWATIWSDDDLFAPFQIDHQGVTDVYFEITDDCCPRMIQAEINHPPEAPVNSYSRLIFRGWVGEEMVGQQTLMCYVPEPTVVQVSSFFTHVETNGAAAAVEIVWRTAFEAENAGFNIHRACTEDGERVTLNEGLMASEGDELQGASYSFTDADVASGATYYYWLESVSRDGQSTLQGPVLATVTWEGTRAPSVFRLAQNHPNPFNPATEIRYDLPVDCHVRLEIYDVAGRRVATLVDEVQKAGAKVVPWDARDVDLGSSIYVYRLRAGSFDATRRMVLLR